MSLLQPTSDKFQDFADKVKERSLRDYNYTISEGEEVNFVIGAFYDGVYLLGMALNETLWEGGDIRDGDGITLRMWNRTFSGKYFIKIISGKHANGLQASPDTSESMTTVTGTQTTRFWIWIRSLENSR